MKFRFVLMDTWFSIIVVALCLFAGAVGHQPGAQVATVFITLMGSYALVRGVLFGLVYLLRRQPPLGMVLLVALLAGVILSGRWLWLHDKETLAGVVVLPGLALWASWKSSQEPSEDSGGSSSDNEEEAARRRRAAEQEQEDYQRHQQWLQSLDEDERRRSGSRW
jgi:hypothetical protein